MESRSSQTDNSEQLRYEGGVVFPFKNEEKGQKSKSRLALILRLHLLGLGRRCLGLAPLGLDAEVVDGPELGLEQGLEL